MVMTTRNETHDLNGKTFQLLAILYPNELHFLQSVVHTIHIPAATAIIQEGQDNKNLYFVKSGVLRVSKKHHDFTFEIGSITPGEIFGEASILYNHPAAAHVHSTNDCELYVINIKHLHEIIQDNSRFNHAIHQLAERRSAAGVLAINPIFSHLPQIVREVLLYNGEYVSLKEGDILFHEGGSNTESMYIILSGSAEVSIQHPSDPHQKITFAHLTSGDEIGEVPIITHKSHAATVIASSTLRLFKISTASLQPCLQRYSDFKHALQDTVHKKLQYNLKALRPTDT